MLIGVCLLLGRWVCAFGVRPLIRLNTAYNVYDCNPILWLKD